MFPRIPGQKLIAFWRGTFPRLRLSDRLIGGVKCISFAAFLLGTVSIASSAASAQAPVGYVLDINGRWEVERGGQRIPLALGQRLLASDVVRIESSTSYDYVVIAGLNGEILQSRRCKIPGNCNVPFHLQISEKTRETKWAIVLDSIMSLLFGDPDRYSVHRVRGEPLVDGVIEMRKGEMNFDSVFPRKDLQSVLVMLKPLVLTSKKSTGRIGPIRLNRESKDRLIAILPNTDPGLYQLEVLSGDERDFAFTNQSAWVLLSNQRHYPRVKEDFEQAVILTKMWRQDCSSRFKEELSETALRAFLHAQLDRLATGMQ